MNGPTTGRLKAVLFDKDGTLIDFNGTWFKLYEALALEFARGDKQEAARLLEIGGYDKATEKFIQGSELAAGTTSTIVRLWLGAGEGDGFDFWKARLDHSFTHDGSNAAVPVPQLEPTLRRLAEDGRKLAVVTNDVQAAAEMTISRLGVRELFSAVIGYDSVVNPKPAADPVHLVCAMFGLEPQEALVIGDNVHDLEMAHNAGAGAAVGVLTGTATRDDLSSLADAVLDSIADLPAWLAEQGR